MCFVPDPRPQSTETGPLVTIELSAKEVRRFIADIDHLRDLRIRLKRLLGQLELAEQTATTTRSRQRHVNLVRELEA
jgi:hypothetical protein